MKVAVIDNGICSTEIQTTVKHYLLMEDKMVETSNFLEFRKDTAHGTICAKIIETYGNIEVIYDICCLSPNGTGDIKSLCVALEFCQLLEIDAVNLSIGIEFFDKNSKDYERLLKICYALAVDGVAIFAAQSNSGFITVPADFLYVYSVENYNGILRKEFRNSTFYAFGHHIIRLQGKIYLTEGCNSYACPYVCALFTKYGLNMPRTVLRNYNANRVSTPAFLKHSGIDLETLAKNFTKGAKNILHLEIATKKILIAEKLSLIEKYSCVINGVYYLELKRDIKYSSFLNKKIPVPILYIIGKNYSRIFDTAEYIAELFLHNGYLSIIASDYYIAKLYGIYYVSSKNIESSLSRLYKHIKANLIIFCAKSIEYINNDDDTLINIFEEGGFQLKHNNHSFKCSSVNEMFNRILGFYQ